MPGTPCSASPDVVRFGKKRAFLKWPVVEKEFMFFITAVPGHVAGDWR